MEKRMPECFDDAVMNEALLEQGLRVGKTAAAYFGAYSEIPYNEDKSLMISETGKMLRKGVSTIAEASFARDGNFCSVDILRNFGDCVEIVEVKSSTGIKDIYLHDIAYQYYVLTSCGLPVRKASLMHINKEYIRFGELDLQELFVLEDVTDTASDMQSDVTSNIARFKLIADSDSEPEQDIGMHCEKPYLCGYMGHCWKHIPENSVFSIAGMRKALKYELYRKGIVSFEQLLEHGAPLNDKAYMQVEAELENRAPHVDKNKITSFLNHLVPPLYFLDFETFQQAIPEYDGVKPYVQIPFQYSLHILPKANAALIHKEFLAKEGTDPRRALAESLCKDIPQGGRVVVFNSGFEGRVLRGLAKLFPDLSAHLHAIDANIADMMAVFRSRAYYNRELKGSYSIKKVLPALCPGDPELDYGALGSIQNGNDAMYAFAELHLKPREEIERIREALRAYCRLDTLSMVKIREKLCELVAREA
jgi:hypothetical protein